MKQKIKRAAAWFGDSSGNVKLSMVIMGAGQFRYGAKGKGVCSVSYTHLRAHET